jgi:multidrug transporter EmrE-like cation transporter
MSYLDIGALVLTEIIGDFAFQKFANAGGINNLFLGITGYIGVVYFLIRSLQGSSILLVNAAWDGLSCLVESIAAMVILGEYFTDPLKYVGIAFIVIGLFFVRMPMVRKKPFYFPKISDT